MHPAASVAGRAGPGAADLRDQLRAAEQRADSAEALNGPLTAALHSLSPGAEEAIQQALWHGVSDARPAGEAIYLML